MYNETYKVIRVIIIANQSMRPPIHRDVMCNVNRYKYETNNGYHGFSLFDENMIVSTCCLNIFSKGINISTKFINTNYLASPSPRKMRKGNKCKH